MKTLHYQDTSVVEPAMQLSTMHNLCAPMAVKDNIHRVFSHLCGGTVKKEITRYVMVIFGC